MIDSLLFLPDVDTTDVDSSDVDYTDVEVHLALDVPHATEPDDATDAQVVAALAATRDGHAHAAAGAWTEASAALARSAAIRDALVEAGVAGPVVAARAWSDVATVRALGGDIAGARAALARVRSGARAVEDLPPDLRAAIAEVEATIGPPIAASPVPPAATPAVGPADALVEQMVGGLLWLDTTNDATGDPTETVALSDVEAETAVVPDTPSDPTLPPPRARIAAIDAAVAIAQGPGAERSPGSLVSRLRRLLKR